MKNRNTVRLAVCAALVGFSALANPIFEGWYADPLVHGVRWLGTMQSCETGEGLQVSCAIQGRGDVARLHAQGHAIRI